MLFLPSWFPFWCRMTIVLVCLFCSVWFSTKVYQALGHCIQNILNIVTSLPFWSWGCCQATQWRDGHLGFFLPWWGLHNCTTCTLQSSSSLVYQSKIKWCLSFFFSLFFFKNGIVLLYSLTFILSLGCSWKDHSIVLQGRKWAVGEELIAFPPRKVMRVHSWDFTPSITWKCII